MLGGFCGGVIHLLYRLARVPPERDGEENQEDGDDNAKKEGEEIGDKAVAVVPFFVDEDGSDDGGIEDDGADREQGDKPAKPPETIREEIGPGGVDV